VRFDAERSRASERALLGACDRILVASPEELERYRRDPLLRPKLVHKPWRLPAAPVQKATRARPRFDGGFIAGDDVMNLDALLHFCRAILPRIREREPGWTLLIAGTVAKKAERLVGGLPGVTVGRRVDPVRLFYEAIGVAVIPLRFGTGVSIKTLEALGYGCPVVSTSVGVRGLPAARRGNVEVADDADSFADAAMNAARRSRMEAA
jgi:glycosyltransferase involved in cell wall biosynthesis